MYNLIYKRLKKGICSLCILLFFGILCCICGVYGFARYTTCEVDGINITGLMLDEARQRIEKQLQKELKTKKLTVQVEDKYYTFSYPQLYYRTNLPELLQKVHAKKGEFHLQKELCLTNLEESLRGICDAYYRQSIDATVLFHGSYKESKPTFQYTRDRAGRYIDGKKLKQDVEQALQNNFKREKLVVAKTIYKNASFQVHDARQATRLLASFSTYFSTSNAERTHNIQLASQFIDGSILQPNMVFSFNERTGPRTVERGFKEAHIIQEGEFVNGVGGGVCQASTTVYNCALLAGLKIVEYHPHSLSVGYISASFDAMVNGRVCDLKFKNCYDMPVYIASKVIDNQLRVQIYGFPTGMTYKRESVILEKIPPKEPEFVYGDEEKILRPAKEGIRSEGYLIIQKNGILERKKIRTDYYRSVQGKIQIVKDDRTKNTDLEEGVKDLERQMPEND